MLVLCGLSLLGILTFVLSLITQLMWQVPVSVFVIGMLLLDCLIPQMESIKEIRQKGFPISHGKAFKSIKTWAIKTNGPECLIVRLSLKCFTFITLLRL